MFDRVLNTHPVMVINKKGFFDFGATLVCKANKIRCFVEFQDLEKNT